MLARIPKFRQRIRRRISKRVILGQDRPSGIGIRQHDVAPQSVLQEILGVRAIHVALHKTGNVNICAVRQNLRKSGIVVLILDSRSAVDCAGEAVAVAIVAVSVGVRPDDQLAQAVGGVEGDNFL